MRQIASLQNSEQAERLADHLRSIGIASTVDSTDGGFRIWVHNDDHVTKAKAELQEFLANPEHPRYRDASRRAMQRLHEDAARMRAARRNIVNLADQKKNFCPITYGLIGFTILVCSFVGFMSDKNHNLDRLDRMWFSNDGTLEPILHGEVWRLVTPIFLHGNMMHLVFNILMLYQLGWLIETRLGSLKFLSMVLTIAVLSNFAEFLFAKPILPGFSGIFGGMSGVNYGLFGYCWIKGRLEPESGFALNPQAVTMMLVWFFICLFGIVGGIANWVHGVGLVTGVAMAYAGVFLKPLLRRR